VHYGVYSIVKREKQKLLAVPSANELIDFD